MHCALVSEYFSFLNARSQTLYPTANIQRSSGSGLYFQNGVSLGTYVERPDPGKIAGNLVARSAVRMTAAEWQAAMHDLILVATMGGPTMIARIGIMRALNRQVERVFNPDRKDHHWGHRKLKGTNENRVRLRQYKQTSRRRQPAQGARKYRRRGKTVG